MAALNPVWAIKDQIAEPMIRHLKFSKPQAHKRSLELLEQLGVPSPDRVMETWPHTLSGGMRQRIAIAMALACKPDILIADEPTTALDVTVQAQIMSLIKELQDELGMAMLLITHDLGIVSEVAHDVSVMYAGQVVEAAPTRDLFHDPRHPYTQGLFASLPARNRRGQDLMTLDGIVPDAANWPTGCRFAERCVHKLDVCSTAPQLRVSASGRQVRCHLPSALEVTK
jgi:oligopeptide/dipeptide ABC transporter ATP-binding protein